MGHSIMGTNIEYSIPVRMAQWQYFLENKFSTHIDIKVIDNHNN